MKLAEIIVIAMLLLIVGCSGNNATEKVVKNADDNMELSTDTGSAQVVLISLHGSEYSFEPSTIQVNKPAILRNDGSLNGCGLYVVQRELGIKADFSEIDDFAFTPKEKGTFTVTCGMGMYRGKLTVL